MATSTELLRAAEHMRNQDKAIAEREAHDQFGRDHIACWVRGLADALEREARRLQAIEAQQDGTCDVCKGVGIRPGIPSWNDCQTCGGHGRVATTRQTKRSWPEGWPPFAVLRRAYEQIDSVPVPSTRWCEGASSTPHYRTAALRVRGEWLLALHGELSADEP